MGAFQAINSILPLAFTSGINLYLTVLVVGCSIRFGVVPEVPPSMQVLASTPVLAVTGVLYALEFFADKIPFVDNVWDIIHTFIRPIGAAILTVASLTGLVDPQTEIIAALVASVVALTSHSGKAGTRTAINLTSPVENITNVLVSLAEDALVAILVLLALMYPTIANAITIILLALILIFVPPALRWSWFTLHAIVARLRAFVQCVEQSEPLPPDHAALLPAHAPALTIRSQGQRIKRVHGRRGYLSLAGDGKRLWFTYRRRSTIEVWNLEMHRVISASVRQRLLLLILELVYNDEKQRTSVARFVFTKDRAPLVNQFVARLGTVVTHLPFHGERVARENTGR